MSKMQWFRLHTEILADEKILSLAVSDRWYFVAVMCLKSDGMLEKYEGAELNRKVAIKLGLDGYETEELKRRLCAENLINEQWQPLSWEKRQYQSDLGAAQRMRNYRAKKKSNNNNDPRNERNAVTQALRPDTDTDTEKKKARVPRDALLEVLDKERAEAVIEHRQRIRKPLTVRAAQLLAQKFQQCPNPNIAADAMIANGWQGFEPSWLESRVQTDRAQSNNGNTGVRAPKEFPDENAPPDGPKVKLSPNHFTQKYKDTVASSIKRVPVR